MALQVGAPLTSQRYDDSRYNNRISIGGFDFHEQNVQQE